MASQALTLTLEPVAACNLGCAYCYAANADATPASPERFAAAIGQVVGQAARQGLAEVHCVWLGGEPLLAGPAFFERVLGQTARIGGPVQIRHFLQTNGLLLDDAFCRLFREAGVCLGLSLDGPRDIHDANRRTRQGEPTFDAVMAGLDRLAAQDLPFGCVAVVTRQTLGRESEIYDFFCGLGRGFRLNPVIPAPGPGNAAARITAEEYGLSLTRFFDAWSVPRPDRVPVSPLDSYLHAVAGGQPRECQQRPSCAPLSLGIKPNGDLVRCGRFQDHVLGNLADTSLAQLLGDPAGDPLAGRADRLAACRACPHFAYCHGGCPHNAVAFGHDPMTKDPFCAAYKMIYSHLKKALGA